MKKIFDDGKEDEKPLIDPDKLTQGLDAIKEGVSAFDFDMVDMVMKDFAGYKMPEDFKPKYEKLKVMVSEVDAEGIMQLLEG